MARHSKKIPFVIAALVLLVGAFAIVKLSTGPFSKLEAFPVERFVQSPTNYLGNEYLLRAQIDSQLSWEPETGRLLAVTPEAGEGRLPVFVPSAVGANMHVGQRYKMRVVVRDGGLVYVESLSKY